MGSRYELRGGDRAQSGEDDDRQTVIGISGKENCPFQNGEGSLFWLMVSVSPFLFYNHLFLSFGCLLAVNIFEATVLPAIPTKFFAVSKPA